MMIELIKDVNKLEGTCYFELLPGTFQQKCWNEGSVYLTEEDWDYLRPIVEKHIDNYDHYSFMSIDKTAWLGITKDLIQLKQNLNLANSLNELSGQIGFFFRDSENRFEKDFAQNKFELTILIDDLVLWLQKTLKHHNQIAVLGI